MAHTVVEGQLGDPAKAAGVADDDCGLGIGDEVFHLRCLIRRIQRQKHMAGAQRGQVQHHGFNRLFHLHRNAAAFGQIQRHQQIRNAGAAVVQIRPGVVKALTIWLNRFHGDFLQVCRKGCAQGAEKIGLRHIGHRDAVELNNGGGKKCSPIIGAGGKHFCHKREQDTKQGPRRPLAPQRSCRPLSGGSRAAAQRVSQFSRQRP